METVSTTPIPPPVRMGRTIDTAAELFRLMKQGHSLVLVPGPGAADTPSYYVEVDGLRRRVVSTIASRAVGDRRLGHGMPHPGGGFFWKQTTRTP